MKTENQIVESSFSALINAPIEKINLPDWAFNLSEAEYQGCSPAHVAVGKTIGPDGKRMSINVEVIGGNPMVQHYTETVSEPHHLVLISLSDVFTPTGRVSIYVTWELSVRPISENQCEFTNRVVTHATDELLAGLQKQGIPFELFKAMRQPLSIDHNKTETPFFAASIERYALR
ncbi:hypothetical protein AAFN85_29780 [Mucilaginibacter sp. CAU 1740]|uniref:hypothetical protein n=1 Tax=Mucilaginibacter sp. CAU 1740 TaxID=3140365 RepID=UPI00325B6C3E